MKFIKQRIPVLVAFADTAGELATLEGRVRYAAGDALMTEGAGEPATQNDRNGATDSNRKAATS